MAEEHGLVVPQGYSILAQRLNFRSPVPAMGELQDQTFSQTTLFCNLGSNTGTLEEIPGDWLSNLHSLPNSSGKSVILGHSWALCSEEGVRASLCHLFCGQGCQPEAFTVIPQVIKDLKREM